MNILNQANTNPLLYNYMQQNTSSPIRDDSEIHQVEVQMIMNNDTNGGAVIMTGTESISPLSNEFKKDLHAEINKRGGVEELVGKDISRLIGSFV